MEIKFSKKMVQLLIKVRAQALFSLIDIRTLCSNRMALLAANFISGQVTFTQENNSVNDQSG